MRRLGAFLWAGVLWAARYLMAVLRLIHRLRQRWHDFRHEGRITPVSELYRQRGMRPASAEDFERIAGHLPTDGEG